MYILFFFPCQEKCKLKTWSELVHGPAVDKEVRVVEKKMISCICQFNINLQVRFHRTVDPELGVYVPALSPFLF